jgi:peptide deformylase
MTTDANITTEGNALPIIRKGHPGLEVIAKPVENINDSQQVASDLIATLLNTGTAVGLAATQVNIPLRVIVFRIPIDRADDGKEVPLTVAFNPVIEYYSDEQVLGWEGCLSVPGLLGEVPRSKTIRYSYTTIDNQKVEQLEVHGFHARLIQHEVDHLDGITYIQRMKDMSRLGFTEEMKEYKVKKNDVVDED